MPVSQDDLIEDLDETLLRQAHEKFVVDNRLTSQAFIPNSDDGGLLSVDRQVLIDPKDAYKAYLARDLNSVGVWGVLVGEFKDESLSSYKDPLHDSPAHALVDYTNISGKPLKRVATKLATLARARGRLHPVENP